MKASLLKIKFNPGWILKGQSGGKSSVIEEVIRAVKSSFEEAEVFVSEKAFHQCEIVIALEDVVKKDRIKGILNSCSFSSDTDSGLDIEILSLDNKAVEEKVKNAAEELTDSQLKRLEKEFNFKAEVKAEEPKENQEAKKETLNTEELIGLEPLKEWINEIELIAEKHKDIALKSKVITDTVYFMSMNKGSGVSTALKIMADTLEKYGFMKFSNTRTIECDFEYIDDQRAYQCIENVASMIAGADNGRFRGIALINIEEWIEHLSDKRFDLLLKIIWSLKDKITFVIRIPYADNNVTQKVFGRINDIFNSRMMRFVPLSDKQYFSFFKARFKKYDISVAEDAFAAFSSKLAEERNDGKFYGFNTVTKIINEMLYKMIAEAAKNGTDMDCVLSKQRFKELYGISEDAGISGIEQLNGMVALCEVKNKVCEILSAAKFQKEMFECGKSSVKPCFHMMFLGNPGTGKTVVARIIGRIFKEEGLLSVGNFFEVSRQDFVGQFVGHTAPKTMEICRSAYGSVLFIDEAYLLANDDSYSKEAIGTLIAEMENNRDKMIVIFAGYENDLEKLFEMNSGLRDRIPYKIHFPNYNRDELRQIFYIQLNGKMRYDNSFEERANEFFSEFPESVLSMKDFSNGRFVRNLAERIISKAALRFEMSNLSIEEFMLSANDFDVAVADNDFKALFAKEKKVQRIGF